MQASGACMLQHQAFDFLALFVRQFAIHQMVVRDSNNLPGAVENIDSDSAGKQCIKTSPALYRQPQGQYYAAIDQQSQCGSAGRRRE